eukprot:TRINITY_DN1285_c0_g1_i1.p1 TRINITY_DN1285_c0_g1~~TRINITY_DN1285_c0_g1_i1.p1  ORF type:complete len:812 (+),score=295.79 TRINITY_DN1285_c0_g1_i1:1042-3477(+)
MGVIGNLWRNDFGLSTPYLEYPANPPDIDYVIIPLRFLLLMSLMIPISLKVTLDITKYIYALFINWDLQMYDEENDVPAEAKNTAIAEDLGQIEYVFSDKTGTLTENIMRFRKCSINDCLYGHSNNCNDALLDPALMEDVRGNPVVQDFFRALALCHTVVPSRAGEHDEDDMEDDDSDASEEAGELIYQASSPDEEALVLAAKEMNVTFTDREQSTLTIEVMGHQEQYELLETLEFSSDRKRMSVLVRNEDTDEIFIYIKGADDKILKRLAEDQDPSATSEHLEQLAAMGLRTLLIGVRRVTEEEYDAWKGTMQEAKTAIKKRDEKLAEAYELMERDFALLGATAIEDRLQEEVPEVIHLLRQAGITFWMLTGDKYSTAIQIATACNLMSPEKGKGGADGKLLPINGKTIQQVGTSIAKAKKIAQAIHKLQNVTVIIEGESLVSALKDHSDDFLELCMMAKAVICCRVTPQQKADVVKMVKVTGKRCLSIGDGGNDVSMIQEAHVGVGISGREGLQAARAADYAIGKFKYLKRLMLIHGRYAYHRTSLIAQYSFFKSFFIGIMQVTYGLFSGLSGTTFLNSFMVVAYNTFYTGVPVFFVALDKDVQEESVFAHPYLYLDGQKNRFLNTSTIAWWIVRGFYQGLITLLVMLSIYNDSWLHPLDGKPMDYLSISTPAYTAVIIIQTATIAYETNEFTGWNHFVIWGSLVFYFISMIAYNMTPGFEYFGVFTRLMTEPGFWLSTILTAWLCMMPIIATKYYYFTYHPMPNQLVRQMEAVYRKEHPGEPVLLPKYTSLGKKNRSRSKSVRKSMKI